MASQALALGINIVVAPTGVPVTFTTATGAWGFTEAGAVTGPALTSLTTWPANDTNLSNFQNAPAVPPGYAALFLNITLAGSINYPS